jgi:hypothetical protein
MNFNNKFLENKNKNYIYNKLYINSIKYIYNQLKLANSSNKYKDCSFILKKTANERYNIECILNKLFPYLRLDFNLEKFGRSRSKYDLHGRNYVKMENNKNSYSKNKKKYIPFNFLLDDNYEEPILTPINVKYKNYKDKVKEISINNNIDINILYKTEPLLKFLYTYEPKGCTIIYKNIELTTFYYECNDNLYNELKTIPIHDRLLTTDQNMYRAIYHTNPKNHIKILQKINKKYNKIRDNINNPNYNQDLYNENIKLVKKIYWWLSHATLYDRGSCAITEIFCNALFLFIDINTNFMYFTNNYSNNNNYKPEFYYNTDIEAMLESNPNTFVDKFDTYIKFTELPNETYKNININNIINGTNNNNYKRLYDYEDIENINILEYLSNFSINVDNNDNLNDLINEFKIENNTIL